MIALATGLGTEIQDVGRLLGTCIGYLHRAMELATQLGNNQQRRLEVEAWA